MKPDSQAVLAVFAELIAGELTPLMAERYGLQQLVRGSPLLSVIAADIDRAAARRFEENQALRRLFGEAALIAGEPGLSARLREAASGADTDLSVSSLDAGNRVLRSLLIDLQIWAESQNSTASIALEQKIWSELRISTERRRAPMDRF